jgi:hypothetical protein
LLLHRIEKWRTLLMRVYMISAHLGNEKRRYHNCRSKHNQIVHRPKNSHFNCTQLIAVSYEFKLNFVCLYIIFLYCKNLKINEINYRPQNYARKQDLACLNITKKIQPVNLSNEEKLGNTSSVDPAVFINNNYY